MLEGLTGPDLDAPAAFPWPPDSGLAVEHTAAWVNGELMKNVAELGQLRLLRAARRPTPERRPRRARGAPGPARSL